VKEIPYETVLAGYTGTVEATLWESAMDAGMDPLLIDGLADVFAFDIDFTREVRSGDRYRLVVEQKLLEGKPAGFGRILAAEYVAGKESHSAIQFTNAAGDSDYFSTDGESLRRMFLRSPLKYRRISSRFGGRKHPTLGYWKKHEGVDYAAEPGTPIRSVGDGTVTKAGFNGASGNFVKIRHNGTYETSYSHLKGYGPGVKNGVRVKQGQVIGYVGTTGRSTGPHLHFAFYENGRYIDPLSKRFPSADPVPQKEKDRFEVAKTQLLPLLPEWPADTQTASTKTTAPVPPALAAPLAAR
jgi:murein DD-endopeptidase MepM/ murein hydrolase activator NlpD